MTNVIQLDGAAGGGQMLRTALSLAMVTGQPFRMVNIRAQRSRPGLMRQHLTCVQAACAISGGSADGAATGSTELVFRAAELQPGNYRFAIGTAGSVGLLFQTLLPALLHADAPSTLELEGGTHNPLAPPFEFLDRVFLPVLRHMGAGATLELRRTGFAPAGGGVMTARIEPCAALRPVHLTERPESGETRIRVIARDIPMGISGRMLDAALRILPSKDAAIENRDDAPGAGICCLIEAQHGECREMTCAFGQHGTPAEIVGRRAAKAMRNYLATGVPVGKYLADQLLLPMALAGEGSVITLAPDNHVPTNISVIEQFLPVKFECSTVDRGNHLIQVSARPV
jgi:RNA 3'-terminal phosphate cyclase (ATP)